MKTDFPYRRVMVTGGSGYIASWIVYELLLRGVEVAATVRSTKDADKIAHLEEMQAQFPHQLELFEADLGKVGSFDRAAVGCYALFHCASPFIINNIQNPEEQLLKPAREGTLNVLQAASRSQSIKKVVLTSSVAAVHSDNRDWMDTENGVLDENSWNTGSDANYQPYSYSKTIAEHAAWEYAKQQDQWTMVAVNPSFVIGPSRSNRMDGTSMSTIASFFAGQFKIGIPDLHFGMVDVRDVARAHILALENPKADGRFILMSEQRSFFEVGEILNREFGGRLPVKLSRLPKALFYLIGPFLGFSWRYTRNNYGIPVKLDTARSREILGLEYRSVRDSVIDHARQLIEDGLVRIPE